MKFSQAGAPGRGHHIHNFSQIMKLFFLEKCAHLYTKPNQMNVIGHYPFNPCRSRFLGILGNFSIVRRPFVIPASGSRLEYLPTRQHCIVDTEVQDFPRVLLLHPMQRKLAMQILRLVFACGTCISADLHFFYNRNSDKSGRR